MIGLLKGWAGSFAEVFTNLPDGLRTITEFIWRIRWFLFAGWCVYLMTVVLPYLMIAWFVNSLFSFLR